MRKFFITTLATLVLTVWAMGETGASTQTNPGGSNGTGTGTNPYRTGDNQTGQDNTGEANTQQGNPNQDAQHEQDRARMHRQSKDANGAQGTHKGAGE